MREFGHREKWQISDIHLALLHDLGHEVVEWVGDSRELMPTLEPEPTPTYSLSVNANSEFWGIEGESFLFNISTTNVDVHTPLYYSLVGDGITDLDFTSGSVDGSTMVDSDGKGAIKVTTTQDHLLEGDESFKVFLYTDITRTKEVLATSPDLVIVDGSTATFIFDPDRGTRSPLFEGSPGVPDDVFTYIFNGSNKHATVPEGTIDITDYGLATQNVHSVSIPDSVFSIGEDAFTFNQLTELVIPDSVISIGEGAFSFNQLKELVIPDSVTHIGDFAFIDNQLTEVVIPDSVISIGENTFDINPLNKVVIGDSLTSIRPGAFMDLQLKEVVIGDSVVSIDESAFSGNQLTELLIPDSVTHIGDFAFVDNQLKEVVIPDSVTSIGVGAFTFNQLKELVIPNSVTSIGAGAFGDNQLKEVVIPDSVDTIGKCAFCKNDIKDVILPSHFKKKLPLSSFDPSVSFRFDDDSTPQLTPTPTPTPSPVPTPTPTPTLTGDPPKLFKATLRGKDITLQFESLLSNTLPRNSRFTLNQGNREYQVIDTKIMAEDGIVKLTAEKELDPTVDVTLDYLDFPGDQSRGVIESPTGVDLGSFNGFKLNNQGFQVNSLTVDDGEFEGSQITLYLTAPIADGIPSKRRFKVKAANKKQKILGISTEPDDGIIVLTTKKNLDLQESIFVSYSDLSGDQVTGVIEDLAGNDMATIQDFEIVSGGNDATAPKVSSATLDENTLSVEFDSIIRNTSISKNRFKVKVDGKKIRVLSATIEQDDSYVDLALKPKNLRVIDINSTVTLAYKDPKGDQTKKVVEDLFGNDLDSFSGYDVEIVKI